ncbi:MAG: hypothetical protein HC875_23955 [Anaerolineales bacterium]|nr:hypothetical protein [Anaerolineales bacterium]
MMREDFSRITHHASQVKKVMVTDSPSPLKLAQTLARQCAARADEATGWAGCRRKMSKR